MNASDVVNSITEFLEKEELKYEYNEELMRFDYGFSIDHEIVQKAYCYILVDDEGDDCLVVGDPYIRAKDTTKKELELLLFGINCHLVRGMWQLYDGEVRYARSIALEGDAALTDEMLDTAIYTVPGMITKYADPIVSVAMGYSTADEELKKLYAEEEDAENQSEEVEESPGQTECSFDELESILLWVKSDKDERNNRKV